MIGGTVANVEQIAAAENCTIRQINMTISVAFLAPNLLQAAVDGCLPRGVGIANLRDGPAEWCRQYARIRALGAILITSTRANSNACRKIPYSAEQGIISAEQGILVQEQGIFPAKSEIITGSGFRYTQGGLHHRYTRRRAA
ncbi:MAG: hypothetical protein WB496_27775 [Pseudolabrys sp.]